MILHDSTENIENTDNTDNIENIENIENTYNIENTDSTPLETKDNNTKSESNNNSEILEKEKQENEEKEKQKKEEEEERKRKEREQQRIESLKRQQLLEKAKRKEIEEERKEKERINKWKQVKFEPKFNIKEKEDGFIITGYFPQVMKDDISVATNEKDKLTISGFNYPSKEDEEKLKEELHDVLQYQYGKSYKQLLRKGQLDELLLRMGVGKYGSFTESYRLPYYVDFKNIQSSFEGGVLRIVIPLTKRHITPNTYSRRRNNNFNNFFEPSFFANPMSRQGFW